MRIPYEGPRYDILAYIKLIYWRKRLDNFQKTRSNKMLIQEMCKGYED